ncbi:MAG TPA: hypothetical protein VH186_11990 [Chloroflexia bacterium]|nr:hypothetical protein [Chloroflexia bacterium]
MRSEAELQTRLREAVEARRQLWKDEQKAKKEKDEQLMEELAEEISNISGVITTLEWVLQTGAAPEYE